MSLSTTSTLSLNTSRDSDSTTSLDSLEEIIPNINLNLPWCNFEAFLSCPVASYKDMLQLWGHRGCSFWFLLLKAGFSAGRTVGAMGTGAE